jgi:hypothetical protein
MGVLMGEESSKKPGRPENSVPSRSIDITTVDPVTFRMIEALVAYGRFGRTRPEVALFIIRAWLLEKEEYLKTAILSRENPLGHVYPESE